MNAPKGWEPFILVRRDSDPDEAYVSSGAYNPKMIDLTEKNLEEAVRAAVADFLATSHGKTVFEVDCCSCFNWGDVIQYLPDEFQRKHGFIIFVGDDDIPTMYVDQNESFYPDEMEGI